MQPKLCQIPNQPEHSQLIENSQSKQLIGRINPITNCYLRLIRILIISLRDTRWRSKEIYKYGVGI